MLIVQRIEREWLNCVCAHPNVDITAHWKLAGADTITILISIYSFQQSLSMKLVFNFQCPFNFAHNL